MFDFTAHTDAYNNTCGISIAITSVTQHHCRSLEARKIKAAPSVHHSVDSSSFQRSCRQSAEKSLIYCFNDLHTTGAEHIINHCTLCCFVYSYCIYSLSCSLCLFLCLYPPPPPLTYTHTHTYIHTRTHRDTDTHTHAYNYRY